MAEDKLRLEKYVFYFYDKIGTKGDRSIFF